MPVHMKDKALSVKTGTIFTKENMTNVKKIKPDTPEQEGKEKRQDITVIYHDVIGVGSAGNEDELFYDQTTYEGVIGFKLGSDWLQVVTSDGNAIVLPASRIRELRQTYKDVE